MSDHLYPSDLTDREWKGINQLIPPAQPGGRPHPLEMQLVLTAIFSVVRGRIAWSMLPRESPHRTSVAPDFRLWRLTGTWQRIHDRLRGDGRGVARRHRQPSAAMLGAQGGKPTDVGGPGRGDAAGKKIAGRKRHLLVDGLGLLVVEHCAD